MSFSETFEALFAKCPLKWSKKHYLEKVSATRFQNVGKPYKPNGKHGLSKCKKCVAGTLIKPVENEEFRVSFLQMPLKISKKHHPEKVFATRFQNVGKPYTTNGNMVSQNAKTRCGNPYKTCRKWRRWGPLFENCPQNDQTALPREGLRNAFSERRETL